MQTLGGRGFVQSGQTLANGCLSQVAEFVGRSDKKLQDDGATSHWATQHLPEHSQLVERAKATVNAGHQREAEDRTKFDELYGIKMVRRQYQLSFSGRSERGRVREAE